MYNELYHHGIMGMRWGVRRYQNPDGSLTDAGEKRYSGTGGSVRKAKDDYKVAKKELMSNKKSTDAAIKSKKARDKYLTEGNHPYLRSYGRTIVRNIEIVGITTAAVISASATGHPFVANTVKSLGTTAANASSIYMLAEMGSIYSKRHNS